MGAARRTRLLALAAAGLALAPSPAAAGPEETITFVRRLLGTKGEAEALDLHERILKLDPPVEDLVAGVTAGRESFEALAPGWTKRGVACADGTDRPWQLFVPEGYDPKVPTPLLVALHDRVMANALPKDLDALREPWGAMAAGGKWLLAVPTAQRGAEWWSRAGADMVLRVLAAAKEAANVDEDRVLCAGVGDGGAGCFYLAAAEPSAFAGFAAVSGNPAACSWSGWSFCLRSLADVPFLHVVAGADPQYRAESMTPLAAALAGIGAPYSVEVGGEGATARAALEARAGRLGEWLGAMRRIASPKTVRWEGSASTAARVAWIRPLALGGGDPGSEFPDLNPPIAPFRRSLGLWDDATFAGPGLRVARVNGGTTAHAAGVRAGDVLLELAGRPVGDLGDLRDALGTVPFGGPFAMKVLRGTENLELKGTLLEALPAPAFLRGEPRGVLRASVEGNVVTVEARNVARFEVLLDTRLFDLAKPVEVKVNGAVGFSGPAPADSSFLLSQALLDRDRRRCYAGRISVAVPGVEPVAKGIGARPLEPVHPLAGDVLKALALPGKPGLELLRGLVAKHRPGGTGPAVDLAPVYAAMLHPRFAGVAGKDTAAMALALLAEDPECPGAWAVLWRARRVIAEAAREPGRANDAIEAMVRKGPEAGVKGSAALAVRLLGARAALDRGRPSAARGEIDAVLEAFPAEGSPSLRMAAERMRREACLPEARARVPDFAAPSVEPAGTVACGDLAGRCALVLIEAPDGEAELLRTAAYGVLASLGPYEEAFVDATIPGPEFSPPPDAVTLAASLRLFPKGEPPPLAADFPRWRTPLLEPTDPLPKAFGAAGISALVLLSPTGRVLKASGWDLPGAGDEAVALARGELGPPLDLALADLAAGGWRGFARAWRALAADPRPVEQAAGGAAEHPRARLAMALAAASKGRRVEALLGEPDAADRHAVVARAWCEMRLSGLRERWTAVAAPLRKPDSEEALAVLDVLADLGLEGEWVREELEGVLKRAKDWKVLAEAMRGMAWMDCEADPRPLKARASEEAWQVRLACAEGLRGYRRAESVDALIELAGDPNLRVRDAAARSLEAITTEAFGPQPKRWADWRRGPGRTHPIAPRRAGGPPPEPSTDEPRYATGESYFGTRIVSNRVALVLDKSESMYYGYFDGATNEVERFLRAAGPTTAFTVVEFDAAPRLFSPSLLPANRPNADKALAFLKKAKPYGPTNIFDSLEMALAVPHVDTIVLLSDGLPNRGKFKAPEEILREIGRRNRHQRIAIQALWIVEGRVFSWEQWSKGNLPPPDKGELERRRLFRERAGEHALAVFLQRLARDNEGTFGVAFADGHMPPPGATTRPSTDE